VLSNPTGQWVLSARVYFVFVILITVQGIILLTQSYVSAVGIKIFEDTNFTAALLVHDLDTDHRVQEHFPPVSVSMVRYLW
jgi:hypothetical protein